MRFTLILISVALIPVFAGLLRWHYARFVQPEMIKMARAKLAGAGLDGVDLRLNYFDARLVGSLQDPDARELAETMINELPGVRVLPKDNQIKVTAKLVADVNAASVVITGWLPGIQARRALERLAAEFRPDLKVDVSGIKLSSFVGVGELIPLPEGEMPESFRQILEEIRLPASFSVKREGSRFIVKGTVPRESMRKELIAAIGKSGWEYDASGLRTNEHCGQAAFMTGDALVQFVSGFFASPSPGDFSIDQRNGPRITAYATAAMESAWLGMLRPVSGATKVQADITRVPSPFHFPDYKVTSPIPEKLQQPLKEMLAAQAIYFEEGSSDLPESELGKFGTTVAAIRAAGPDAVFIVAGYGDELLELGSTGKLRVRRAEMVRNRLVAMGVNADSLETSLYESVRTSGPISELARRESRKVELLVK